MRSSNTEFDVLAVLGVERRVVREAQPDVGKLLDDVAEGVDLPRRDIDGAGADLAELLVDGHPVGAQRRDAGAPLFDQAADSDLEELVEVGARDGEELGALQQDPRRVLGKLEHARVVVEPAEMAVDIPMASVELLGVRATRRGGFRAVLWRRNCHQPSSSIAPESRKTRSSAMLVTRSAMRSR